MHLLLIRKNTNSTNHQKQLLNPKDILTEIPEAIKQEGYPEAYLNMIVNKQEINILEYRSGKLIIEMKKITCNFIERIHLIEGILLILKL